MRSNATDIELRVSWKTTFKGKQLCLMEFKKKGCSEYGLGFSTAICSEMRSAKNQKFKLEQEHLSSFLIVLTYLFRRANTSESQI